MARYRLAFAERNRVIIALIGLLAMAIIFALTFNAQSLPGLRGDSHTAYFAESGGLHAGNEVRVAGVKVGEVTSVGLDGKRVEVEFRVKDVDLGDQTTAAVKVKTMLGQKYLAISPAGDEALDGPIERARTTTPYDVNAAFSDLSLTIDEIDTDKLEKSFEVLSDTFKDTPDDVQQIVTGLTSLSKTISTRDTELAELLETSGDVTGVLAERNEEFSKVITDGSLLLGELENRRETVKAMLKGTATLGTELRGLVKDNEKTLKPALAKLDRVSAILEKNQQNLNVSLKKLGPYYRVITSAMGNGHWIDSYICGLFDATQAPELRNDVERNCQPAKGGGR